MKTQFQTLLAFELNLYRYAVEPEPPPQLLWGDADVVGGGWRGGVDERRSRDRGGGGGQSPLRHPLAHQGKGGKEGEGGDVLLHRTVTALPPSHDHSLCDEKSLR